MYRFLSRTVCAARNSSVIVYESCVLPAKCEKAMAKQTEEPVVLMAEDGSTTQQQTDVKTEPVVEKPTEAAIDAAKSGKQHLLDLLVAMKVEVTSKKKFKGTTIKQNYESIKHPESKSEAMESTISMFQKATEAASPPSETLEPDLVAAASAAAATLPDSNRAQSVLLRQLRERKAITEAQKKGDMSKLGEIIADMKVGRQYSRQKPSASSQITFDDDERGYTRDRGITGELVGVRRRRNFFLAKRLNIFSPTTEDDAPTLWDMEFANNLSQVTNQAPRNGFEEMIQWTKEGKMWQYPVDNEAGLEEEASVSFHEHIFLEKHLEEGFPHQGPVRHFMELVVAGLSRNPYLTVQQKKGHISWFRDYFQQKEEVLKEANADLN
uniref:Small ribosomal subunit protein mS31 n=1 Tax=Stegastes partitus TaxID=144197 RepID=A0A3B4Z7Q2_9TELE